MIAYAGVQNRHFGTGQTEYTKWNVFDLAMGIISVLIMEHCIRTLEHLERAAWKN